MSAKILAAGDGRRRDHSAALATAGRHCRGVLAAGGPAGTVALDALLGVALTVAAAGISTIVAIRSR